MSRLLSVALVIGFIPAAAFAQDAALIKRGEAVYAAQKCSACHAIAGKGNARGALDNVGAKLSKDEIHQWIVAAPEMSKKTNSTRKPVMRAYTTLPKEDLEALVTYLQTLKKG
jgi:mono/diheme cytochrome c family protein